MQRKINILYEMFNKQWVINEIFSEKAKKSSNLVRTGVGSTTDSRQCLDSRVHSSIVVTYSRVRPT